MSKFISGCSRSSIVGPAEDKLAGRAKDRTLGGTEMGILLRKYNVPLALTYETVRRITDGGKAVVLRLMASVPGAKLRPHEAAI